MNVSGDTCDNFQGQTCVLSNSLKQAFFTPCFWVKIDCEHYEKRLRQEKHALVQLSENTVSSKNIQRENNCSLNPWLMMHSHWVISRKQSFFSVIQTLNYPHYVQCSHQVQKTRIYCIYLQRCMVCKQKRITYNAFLEKSNFLWGLVRINSYHNNNSNNNNKQQKQQAKSNSVETVMPTKWRCTLRLCSEIVTAT